MNWLWLVSYFFGGIFAANAIPHFVSGLMGRAFQSPFANPPGKGLSSSTVNVVWGFFNAVVAYLLVVRVGAFDLRTTPIPRLRPRRAAHQHHDRAPLRPVPRRQHLRRAHEEPHNRHLPLAPKLQLPPVEQRAPSSPTSAPGCSASPRTGSCSPNSPITTPPRSAS